MKCEEFKDGIWRLFEAGDSAETAEMREHLNQCAECSDYYEQTKSMVDVLTPALRPSAPKDLKDNVMKAFAPAKKHFVRRFAGRIAAGVAASVMLVGGIILLSAPSYAKNAYQLLEESLNNLFGVKNVEVTLLVRTLERDNFDKIEIDGQMVPHQMTIQLEGQKVWKVVKPGRTAMFDGEKYYLWFPEFGNGYFAQQADLLGWMTRLLHPYELLNLEKNLAANEKGVKYRIKEQGDQILLTIQAKAQGDFSNDYMLNSSISESDNRREYIFDRQTKMLKGLKVYIRHDRRDILVMEIENIVYDGPLESSLTTLPAGYEWTDMDIPPQCSVLVDIPADQAARIILEALRDVKKEILGNLFSPVEMKELAEEYAGMEIRSIGEPFRSGTYVGVFVPYEITLKNGTVIKHNLALRNDNPNRVWEPDGGY